MEPLDPIHDRYQDDPGLVPETPRAFGVLLIVRAAGGLFLTAYLHPPGWWWNMPDTREILRPGETVEELRQRDAEFRAEYDHDYAHTARQIASIRKHVARSDAMLLAAGLLLIIAAIPPTDLRRRR